MRRVRRNGRINNKNPLFWIVIILAIIAVPGLYQNISKIWAIKQFSPTSSIVDPTTETSNPTEMMKQQSFALSPTRDTWPPLSDGTRLQTNNQIVTSSNYYVVLDGSGSMRESKCSDNSKKIEAAVTALKQFIQNVPEKANLGLTVFDGAGLSERVPLGQNNREVVRSALEQVSTGGRTPLRSAISLGYQKLVEQGQSQLGYGDYHLVVVTDGLPDPEGENPAPIVRTLLTESPIVLHTIGFCIGTDHVLNQPGRSYYMAANSPEDLRKGLEEVLAESPTFDVSHFQN